MASELRSKKRKSAVDTSPKPKKLKKSDEVAAVKKPSKAPKPAAAEDKTNVAKSPAKIPRKRAADFFEGEDSGAEADALAEKAKKAKKDKPAEEDAPAATALAAANGKKSKKPKAVKEQPVVEEIAPAQEEDEDEDEDDQTAALLAGFESSEDEGEAEAAQQEEGLDIDKLPELPNSKSLRKKLDKASGEDDGPGVLYVGRIPHGFYEHQMRAYFSQFGDLLRLRLSRNRKTGASKHYAFLEFSSAAVADIVAKTMDKYLLFNHILQVRVIPPEQVHLNLFKGAGKRFKVVPRNKMEGALLKRGADRETWGKRISTEEKRRLEKAEKLKSLMGYEYEAPSLKSIDAVPQKLKQIEAAEEDVPKLLTEKPHEDTEEGLEMDVVRTMQAKPGVVTVTEKVKVKKGKKEAKEGAKEEAKEEVKVNIIEKKNKPKLTKANETKVTKITKVKKAKVSVA
ncbi:hypothetical protein AOQ84DRAFT_344459 [Glonium stellatum]|uniref:RRM domain-containing protein n=1 Tax=Glonium stellatum TaxID=574774 RepID=A0A8E2EVX7_9PEZI|nr:hypothetical protein AOQ84DRAFT_344459 [Glonium stellatum]